MESYFGYLCWCANLSIFFRLVSDVFEIINSVETQDDDAQCHSLDFDGNKTIESENVEQPQQILQRKMAKLTTHVIVESKTISIQHVSMTAESDEVDPNITGRKW